MPTLRFTLKCASGIEDKDGVTNNDLYAVITYGGQKTKTEVAKDGIFQGFKYNWNATYNFDLTNDNDLEVKLYDKDWGFDDYIGEAKFDLSHARASGSADIDAPVVNKERLEKGVCKAHISIS